MRANSLSNDLGPSGFRTAAWNESDPEVVNRLHALASVSDGTPRSEIATAHGISLRRLFDIVSAWNAGGHDGLRPLKPPGATPLLDDAQWDGIVANLLAGPPDGYPVSEYRLVDVQDLIVQAHGIEMSIPAISENLKSRGIVKVSCRPSHDKSDPERMEAFKAGFAAVADHIRAAHPEASGLEVWFQDESRIGQKGPTVRRWARRGDRPTTKVDGGFLSQWLFGAVCPERGVGAAIIRDAVNTAAMADHLTEISRLVRPGFHAIVVVDGASWHKTPSLLVPDNLTLVVLPPYSPELNPQERVWHFLKGGPLAHRLYACKIDIEGAAMAAWDMLIDEPGRIQSLCACGYAIGV